MGLTPLLPGDPRRVGDLWLSGRLGAGGQGVVYEAYDDKGTRVAVKRLWEHVATDPVQRGRFAKEVAAASRVASFCTARILRCDLDDAQPYVVTEYVDGPSLADSVARGKPFRGDCLHRLATGMATALAAIHHAGVIHRDLKPDSVLLGSDGPRVIDFGIARTLEMSLTATGEMAGTPPYMAPELFSGKRAGPPVDVFAWGALVLYATTGVHPFHEENIAGIVHRILFVDPDLDGLPEPIRSLAGAALSKTPEDRPTAHELLIGLVGGGHDPFRLMAAGSRSASALRPPVGVGGGGPPLGAVAESVYAALTMGDREQVNKVLFRLLGADEMPRAVARAELPASIVDGFARAGLLAVHGDDVRLTHAALPHAWSRLRSWLNEGADDLRRHRSLDAAARRWAENGADLLHGPPLAEALRWTAAPRVPLTFLERSFLDASATADKRRARRRRVLATALTGLIVAVAASAGVAVQQGVEARAQGRVAADQRAQGVARQLAARAEGLRKSDPASAMLLSVAAWRIAPVSEARSALLASLAQRDVGEFTPPVAGHPRVGTISLDARFFGRVVDGVASIWDVTTGTQVAAVAGVGTTVRQLALAPDASTLAVKEAGTLDVWDVRKGLRIHRVVLDGYGEPRFSPDGRFLLFASAALRGQMLEIGRGTIRALPVETGATSLAVSPDGRLAAAGTADGVVQLVDLSRGRLLRTQPLSRALVGQVEFSPDGRTLLTAAGPQVRLLDAATLRQRGGPLTFEAGVRSRFSPDGRTVASAGYAGTHLWRVSDRRRLYRSAGAIEAAFSADGQRLAARDVDGVRVVDVADYTRPPAMAGVGPDREIRAAALAPDRGLAATLESGAVKVVDMASRRTVKRLNGRFMHPFVAGAGRPPFVLAGDILAAGTADSRVMVWDGQGPPRMLAIKKLRSSSATPPVASALALGADGVTLAVAVPDRTVRLWDLTGRSAERVISLDADALATHPDGRFAAISVDGARLIDSATLRGASVDFPDTSGEPAFSPDGRLLAAPSEAGTVRLWDAASRQPLEPPFTGHSGPVAAIAFSPDGQIMATGGKDRTVRLWDVTTLRPLGLPFTGHTGEVLALAFGGDGRRLWSLGRDGALHTIDVDPGRVVSAVCARAGRDLSGAEWRSHIPELPYRRVCR